MKIRAENIRSEIESNESQRFENRFFQEEIFARTGECLLEEQFIRKSGDKYQPTAKGFLALNKRFEDGKITDSTTTVIQKIMGTFSDTSNFLGAVSSGIFTNIVQTNIGGNKMGGYRFKSWLLAL